MDDQIVVPVMKLGSLFERFEGKPIRYRYCVDLVNGDIKSPNLQKLESIVIPKLRSSIIRFNDDYSVIRPMIEMFNSQFDLGIYTDELKNADHELDKIIEYLTKSNYAPNDNRIDYYRFEPSRCYVEFIYRSNYYLDFISDYSSPNDFRYICGLKNNTMGASGPISNFDLMNLRCYDNTPIEMRIATAIMALIFMLDEEDKQ